MAIFSGKVVSAKFIDFPNNMVIEVLYQEGDEVIPYVLEVDFTQQDFNDLLEDITLEKIQENTEAQLKAERDNFNSIVRKEIDRLWAIELEKIKKAYDEVDAYLAEKYKELDRYAEKEKLKKFQEVQDEFSALRENLQNKFNANNTSISDITAKDLITIIDSKNENSDFVFNAKVAILEDPVIAKSKDKKLKLSIRKSKSLWELFSIYISAKE